MEISKHPVNKAKILFGNVVANPAIQSPLPEVTATQPADTAEVSTGKPMALFASKSPAVKYATFNEAPQFSSNKANGRDDKASKNTDGPTYWG